MIMHTLTPTNELAYLSVADIVTRFADGTLTSRQLVENALARISTVEDPHGLALNAIAELCNDALEQADRLDAERAEGRVRSPLHGVPILIKDNIEVTGLRSAAGSYAITAPAVRDARVVADLRAAGLIILGSTCMAEFAAAVFANALDGYSSRDGLTGNPYALDRSPGGSSSGSAAAVAAGLAPLALGTDTVGSACYPASLCGTTALRSTTLPLDLDGVVPYSSRYDRIALLGRTPEDVAALANVLRGMPLDEGSLLEGLRLSMVRDGDTRMPEEAMLKFNALGIDVNDAQFPCTFPDVPNVDDDTWELAHRVLVADWHRDLPQYLKHRPGQTIVTMDQVQDALSDQPESSSLWVAINEPDEEDSPPGTADEWAATIRDQADEALRAGLGDNDVLVAVAYGPACKLDAMAVGARGYGSGLDALAAFAGWGVLTVPFTTMGDDLPVGVVIVAPAGDDAVLFRAATLLHNVNSFLHSPDRPTFAPPRRG
jgi:amidase